MALIQLSWIWLVAFVQIQAANYNSLKSTKQNRHLGFPWKPETGHGFLWKLGSLRYPRATHPVCPKGHYLHGYDEMNQIKPDAECRACAPETYNEMDENQSMKCSMCTTCDTDRETEVHPCTRSSNRKCACKKGYRDDRSGHELVCIKDPGHIPCQPGQRIVHYANEITCEECPEGMTSFGNETNCIPIVFTTQAQPAEETDHLKTSIIAIIILSVCLASAAFGLIFYCIVKKCRKKRHEPMDLREGAALLDMPIKGLKDKEARKLIVKMKPELLACISVDIMLLSHLLAMEIISEEQKSYIKAQVTENEKADKFLDYVKLKGTKGLYALHKTLADPSVNQKHVANKIEEYVRYELHGYVQQAEETGEAPASNRPVSSTSGLPESSINMQVSGTSSDLIAEYTSRVIAQEEEDMTSENEQNDINDQAARSEKSIGFSPALGEEEPDGLLEDNGYSEPCKIPFANESNTEEQGPLMDGKKADSFPTTAFAVDESARWSMSSSASIHSALANFGSGSFQPTLNFTIQPTTYVNVNQTYNLNSTESKAVVDDLRESHHVFFEKYDVLMDNITIDMRFLAKLIADNIVTSGQLEVINKQTNTDSDKVALLLSYVSKRGIDTLAGFLVVLYDTHQVVAVEAIAEGLNGIPHCEDLHKVIEIMQELKRSDVIECMEKAKKSENEV